MAHILTGKDVGDITACPGLLATAEGPIASVIADGAYDGASVYKAASFGQHDLLPDIIIPPRASSVINDENADTPTARDRHVQYIAGKGCMAWQKAVGHGRRSLKETAVGYYEPIIGPKLQARSFDGQQSEAAITVRVFNRRVRIVRPISTGRA